MTEAQKKITRILREMADEIHENSTGILASLHGEIEELPELSKKRMTLEEECDAMEEIADHANKILELIDAIQDHA